MTLNDIANEVMILINEYESNDYDEKSFEKKVRELEAAGKISSRAAQLTVEKILKYIALKQLQKLHAWQQPEPLT